MIKNHANGATLIVSVDGPPVSSPRKAGVLNSWKEIAAYLGRGVRTVQRWERDIALPIRRPQGTDRSPVLAFPEELDAWLRHTQIRSDANGAGSQLATAENTADVAPILLELARNLLGHGERLIASHKQPSPEAARVLDGVREIVDQITLLTRTEGKARLASGQRNSAA